MSVKLAVFGNPIEHSLSPVIHQHFAQQFGQDLDYSKILVENTFKQAADEFFAQGGLGCNITIPCKLEAKDYATTLTPRAQLAQAVNTLKAERNEQGQITALIGDNTDGFGLYTDLVRLNCPLEGADVVILGAGGASRGIVPPLLHASTKIKSVTIVNRTLEKAQEIAAAGAAYIAKMQEDAKKDGTFDSLTWPTIQALSYAQLISHCYFAAPNNAPVYGVIINATSLSLKGELPPAEDVLYSNAKFAYDLYYSHAGSTVFTQHANSLGIEQAYDGLGMLVSQAALSYEQWFGVRPDIAKGIDFMRQYLREHAV